MNFQLTDDQRQLIESCRGLLARRCDFATRRHRTEAGEGFDRSLWSAFADMGWFGIAVPEDQGGLGLSAIELCLVAEEFGRAQVLEPLVGCAVLPTALLAACAGSQAERLLAGVIDGSIIVAVAHSEVQSRGAVADVRLTARREGAGWRLAGRKTLVLGAGIADTILVVARTEGQAPSENGLTLFALSAETPGIDVHAATLMDWSISGDVVLDGVLVDENTVVGEIGGAYAILQEAVDQAIVVLCAEAVGAMEGAIDITSSYLKERKQFGVAIGTFQALQHRMADMAMDLMISRSAVYRALQSLAVGPYRTRSTEMSGCKAIVTKLGRWTSGQGIQLHGGYGITEEYQVGHYFKRLLVIDALHGRQAFHLARYAKQIAASSGNEGMAQEG